MQFQSIILICGHYGSGKTTFSLNLALQLAKTAPVTLIDMDIVNPYFRSSDHTQMLAENGIRMIAPNFAGSTLDTPSLSPAIGGALESAEGYVLVDVGGDDAGATALGCYKDILADRPYDMLYVINKNRTQIADVNEALGILREIETASGLRATGVINNTHLCGETTAKTVLDSVPYALDFCKTANLPLLFTAYPDFAGVNEADVPNPYPVKALVKAPW